MPWGAIIGAVGAMAGSAIAGSMSQSSAREANEANREAYQNRHQWQVEDLRKAGLNPLLSASPGSAPTAAAMQAAKYDAPDIAGGMAKGSSAKLVREQVNTEKQRQNTEFTMQAKLAAEAQLTNLESLSRQYNADIAMNSARSFSMLPENVRTALGIAKSTLDAGGAEAVNSASSLMRSIPSFKPLKGGLRK